MISAIIKLITKTLKYARLDEAGKALGGIKEMAMSQQTVDK